MDIDFISNGPLSYALPVALIVGAILVIPHLFRGHFAAVIPLVALGAITFVGFHLYVGPHDKQALISAINQRYGISVTEQQAGTLMVDHGYRRYAPDVTVPTKQGDAKPYGIITTSVQGAKKKVMMYQAVGKWHLGTLPPVSAADQEVRELPLTNGGIPSVN